MKLVDVDDRSIVMIKEGLETLGESISAITSKVGNEDSSSAIKITGTGKVIVEQGVQTTKIKVNVNGGDDDVDIQTAGAVKFQGKKFEVNSQAPEFGQYTQGDIVWNDNPQPGDWVGWVCIRTGNPGMWKPFGNIAQ
jgi:uncharacterized protein (AIM24 family)